MEIKRTERCWAGHFCASHNCRYHRNTLLELGERRVVVSSVGLMIVEGKLLPIGLGRLAETMAFEAHMVDGYWEADVSKELPVELFNIMPGESRLELPDNAGILFDEAHERNVEAMIKSMRQGNERR